ncbi:hypothetical protein K27_10760, partial [Klebsiella pneumoniae]
QQYSQLDQAQKDLDAWLARKEEAYKKAGAITAEGEARMQKTRADAANAAAVIEAQKKRHHYQYYAKHDGQWFEYSGRWFWSAIRYLQSSV